MLKKWSCKVLLLPMMLAIIFIIGAISIGYASRPEPPGPGEYIAGPPIVGRLTLDLVSCNGTSDCTVSPGGSGVLNVIAKFSGCCADCFTTCKNSCNVRAQTPKDIPVIDNGDGKLNLLDLTEQYFLWYRLEGWGPKGCHSKDGKEDLIIQNVLSLQSAENNLVADVVILYLLKYSAP